jgi:hypothetical protein
MLPAFLVIGTQRGGTSSLYRYLGAHPDVVPPLRKEIGYFTRSFAQDEGWYRAHFPLAAARRPRAVLGRATETFEATPDYLMHPLAAARAAGVVPDAKLVVLLREPAARAVSHWRHMCALGFESLGFDEALAREEERIAPDLGRLHADTGHDPRELLRFSYALRGHYADQLERWFVHFDRRRVHVVLSEDLYRDPGAAYAGILEFLGLRPWAPKQFANASRTGPSAPVDDRVRQAAEDLRRTYAEPNERLEELLGRSVPWA